MKVKLVLPLLALTLAGVVSACATQLSPAVQGIKEANDQQVSNCKLLGNVAGANAVFVGLAAGIGRQKAKAEALEQAATMGATHVVWSVWSQMGTSMTSEWIGKAFQCK